MRILLLSWEYPPHSVGGMGRHVTELSAALAERGFDVHIVTPMLRGGAAYEQSRDGVTIHRIVAPPMEGYEYTMFVQQTNQVLVQAAQDLGVCDLIHAHDWLVAEAGITLKNTWQRPLVATIHATERGRQQGYLTSGHSSHINALEWRLTYESWRVIACSHFMAEQIQEFFETPKDKIDVVPNGVRVRKKPFETEREEQAFRKQYAPKRAPLIFYVGRLVFEKGVHLLIEAWPAVLATAPEARLVIAGTGGELERLQQRSQDLELSERITFTGFITDADRERLYHIATMAVFPSIYEPFGIVALEAMAAGCAVVVASSGGLAEVVRHHETGITVYPNDSSSLTWGINHTLQHPKWAKRRAENALREVRDLYDWAVIGEATAAIYERTVADWRRAGWGI
jgi:glycogen synthase